MPLESLRGFRFIRVEISYKLKESIVTPLTLEKIFYHRYDCSRSWLSRLL